MCKQAAEILMEAAQSSSAANHIFRSWAAPVKNQSAYGRPIYCGRGWIIDAVREHTFGTGKFEVLPPRPGEVVQSNELIICSQYLAGYIIWSVRYLVGSVT